MRFRIIVGGLCFFMANATPIQAQPELRDRAWQIVPRTPPDRDGGARHTASVTFIAVGYFASSHWISPIVRSGAPDQRWISSIVRRGNAVRFEILTISRSSDHPSLSTDWREYVGDCATLKFGVISAWARANRRWARDFPRDPTDEESGVPTAAESGAENKRFGHIIRAACGYFPFEGHTADPERTAREIFARR